MHCSACGEKYAAEARFCGACGAVRPPEPGSLPPSAGVESKAQWSRVLGWIILGLVVGGAGGAGLWFFLMSGGEPGDEAAAASTTLAEPTTSITVAVATSRATTTTTEPVTTTQPPTTTTTTLVPDGFALIEWGPGGPKVGLPIDWDPARGTLGEDSITAEILGRSVVDSFANPGVLLEWWVGPGDGYLEESGRLVMDRWEQTGVHFINDLQCDPVKIVDALQPEQWDWYGYIEGASIEAVYEVWADCDSGTDLTLVTAIGPYDERGPGETLRYRIFIQEEAAAAEEILRVIVETFDPGPFG